MKKMFYNTLKQGSAFTLIEMLVVVSILAVVGAVIGACLFAGLRVWDRADEFNRIEASVYIGMMMLEKDVGRLNHFYDIPFKGEREKFSFPRLLSSEIESASTEKVRGKMLGLVQLAKYLTGTESPRPAAEIPDASCLRSGCHDTRVLAGRVDFDGIPFDHAPHLERLRRGKRLRCTSCHSQIVQGTHMTVTQSTCFLCHFKDEFFNEGLAACTRCHQIPVTEYDFAQ